MMVFYPRSSRAAHLCSCNIGMSSSVSVGKRLHSPGHVFQYCHFIQGQGRPKLLLQLSCGFRVGRSTVKNHLPFTLVAGNVTRVTMATIHRILVNITKLFRILLMIGCPTILLGIIKSFHVNMYNTAYFKGATFVVFPVSSGMKHGCILAPTFLRIIFSMLL